MKGIFVRTLVPPEQVVLGVSQPGQLVDHPVVRDHLFQTCAMIKMMRTMMRTIVKTYGKVLLVAGDVGDGKTDCSQYLKTRMGNWGRWLARDFPQ